MFEMSVNLKVITMRIGKKAGSSSFSAKKVKLFSVGEYSPTRGPLGNIPQLAVLMTSGVLRGHRKRQSGGLELLCCEDTSRGTCSKCEP